MSLTVLIECSPRRPADGVVVPLRLVFNSVARANFLGVQWHPAVVAVPAFESSLGFDGRQFGAAPSPQIGELIFALTAATRFAASLVWTNAAVTMMAAPWTATGGDPADGDFATIWTGQAEDIATGNGEARVRLLDNGQALRVPALAGKFGSTGDALLDGADALKDRSAETRVPRAWGRLLSIPGLIVDRANGIWLFAGNAATSVQAFYDGGAAFTLGVARASLAALQANVPADGAVDYCLDAGGKFLARPWDTPTYPFTAAATFGSARAADIASAIVTGRTAVTFTAGTVAAFNALQGADCGLYLDDETSVAAALDRLFSGLGCWWRLSSAGTISLGRWGWTTPALTLPSHRRHAPERLRVLAPTRRRSLGFARNDRVHSEAEIARILLADTLAYADGTLVESLKPAQAGADVTAANTSADTAAVAGVPAATLTADAATAKSGAASALSQISTIASDGVFDRTEKPAVKQQYDVLLAEQATIGARAASFGITTERTAYDNAITALTAYLTGLSATWFDPATDIAITRATFNGKFADVYFARQIVLDKIANVARNDDPQNLIRDPIYCSSVVGNTGGVSRVAETSQAAPFAMQLVGNCFGAFADSSPANLVPVVGGQAIHANWRAYYAAGSGTCELRLGVYDGGGGFITTYVIAGSLFGEGPGDATLTWKDMMISTALPVQAPEDGTGTLKTIAFCWPHWAITGDGGGGGHKVLRPYVGYIERSATLGANARNLPPMFSRGVQLTYSVEPLSSSNTAGVGSITIAAHSLTDDVGTISYSGGTLSGLTPGTRYAVYDDDPGFAGGARTYVATALFADLAVPGRRLVGYITVPATAGGTDTGTGGGTGGGGRPGGGGTAIP